MKLEFREKICLTLADFLSLAKNAEKTDPGILEGGAPPGPPGSATHFFRRSIGIVRVYKCYRCEDAEDFKEVNTVKVVYEFKFIFNWKFSFKSEYSFSFKFKCEILRFHLC